MYISQLLILLLLSIESAYARLVERQDILPAAGAAREKVLWGTLKLFRGQCEWIRRRAKTRARTRAQTRARTDDSGFVEQDPSSDTKNTPSNKQPSTDAPAVAPASSNDPVVKPALDSPAVAPVSPSFTDPSIKLKIDNLNSPSQLPGFLPNLPAVAPPVDEECDPTNAVPRCLMSSRCCFKAWSLRELRLIWVLVAN